MRGTLSSYHHFIIYLLFDQYNSMNWICTNQLISKGSIIPKHFYINICVYLLLFLPYTNVRALQLHSVTFSMYESFFIEPLCCFNKCVLTLVQYCWLSELQTLRVRRVVAEPGSALLAIDCETKSESWVVVVAGAIQLGSGLPKLLILEST